MYTCVYKILFINFIKMAIEIKKPSIDGEKELVKEETVKEVNDLRKEVEKNESITRKDVETYIKHVKEGMAKTMGTAALEAAENWVQTEEWLLIDPKELNSLDKIYWAIILSVRHNPNAYLEKDENGKVYMPKDKFVKLISSFRMSQEDHDVMMKVMQKYEIE